MDTSPRNWIPKGRRKPLIVSEKHEKLTSHYARDESYRNASEKCEKSTFCCGNDKLGGKQNKTCKNSLKHLETDDNLQSTGGQSDKSINRCLNENENLTV